MTHSDTLDQSTHGARQTSVLIVGAGPTGLTLAVELARRGVAFHLIDRKPSPSTTSRALGVQPRTIEVFRIMGIPEAALAPSLQTRGVEYRDGPRLLATISEFGPLVVEQATTERVLEQQLALLGERITWGMELVDLQREPDGVVATVRDASGLSAVRSRYLVGADGAHSTVRSLAGIGFTGKAYPEDFILADVELDWPLTHDWARVWVGDNAITAALPLPETRRWRLIATVPDGHGFADGAPQTDIAAHAVQALRERSELPVQIVSQPAWASHFHIQRRLADRYREGPIFLAGDAAHVHSPLGGLGMNTGIQDAFNLGWKLALAVQGQAAPGLLDTYQDERRPVAEDVLRGTDLATGLLLGQNPIARAYRHYAVPLLGKLAPVRQRLAHALSEFGIAYPRSPLSIDARSGHGLGAGDRVPDASLLAAPPGGPLSLFELISRGWLLLLFAGNQPPPERLDALQVLARETGETAGDMIQRVLIARSAPERETDLPIVLDPNGELARTFGAERGLAALVRPDGYLGYRGAPEQRLELASYLARIYAMRLRGLEPHDNHNAAT